MKEENKNLQEAPQTVEERQTAKPAGAWKRLLSKKWAYPAIYMAAAAIIFSLMWWYQGSVSDKLAGSDTTAGAAVSQTDNAKTSAPDDAVPANAAVAEEMQWPVTDHTALDIVSNYYDKNASAEDKAAAMLQVEDQFIPQTGIALAREDEQTFDVLAAKSGKVTAVDKQPLTGQLVEITHPDGLVTVYQSLDNVKVKVGAEVKKGDVIAQAGRNELEKDEGVHLHFEIRQGETTLNPTDVLPK
ncbi:peptidoglycan DD-metalloendopeptidase family protein [Gorillibacterium sp. sgz500922]|uniref:peptidoglycan DD-metalloendopeptidase family protein n=1 Tax=Gorillibacterium sp. sgz500922 TaxID=3446694 RepID=UPI003F6616A0